MGERLHVEYTRLQNTSSNAPAPDFSFQILSQERSSGASVSQSKGQVGEIQSDFVTSHISGNRLGWRLNGTAPTEIHSVQLNYVIEGDETIERGS